MCVTGCSVLQIRSFSLSQVTAVSRFSAGLGLLALLLMVAVVFSSVNGAYHIDISRLAMWWVGAGSLDDVSQNVWANIRMPRIFLGVVAGAALGVSGAVMQALFRNPLAEPGLVGLSAGASLGAVIAIVLTAGGLLIVASAAFVGSLLATCFAYVLGRMSRSASGLLLAGIAINTIVFSVMGLLIINANDAQLRDLTFWNMGSLAGANWSMLVVIGPWTVLVVGLLLTQWKVLNALLLGEREAFHLGYSLSSLRWQLITLVALTVGPIVALTGGIGFVGLVVPHLVRLWLGSDHRWVLPASALGGSLALTMGDWLARVLIAPSELPIGLVTSLIGGPFFIWLLVRGRR